MKTTLFDQQGNKKADIELPPIFNSKIREDIALKFYESYKFSQMQPYANDPRAGKKHSASGTISHQRHQWKGHYGKGIARVPRKTMWRRGTQFYWIGAEVTSARGGRRVHGPMLWKAQPKINDKEVIIAMQTAFASTANKKLILSRYSSLSDINTTPAVIEKLPEKSKELSKILSKIFGNAYFLVLKHKSVRAGRGKSRGRKYKSNAGLLIVTSEKEDVQFNGLDVKKAKDVRITDLFPLGRLTLYTKAALEEIK